MTHAAVLVTGASSELMRRVIGRIDRARYRVVGLTRDATRLRDAGIEVRQGDVRDPALVAAAVSGADIVVHAAGLTHARDARAYLEVNVGGTRNVVDACRKTAGTRLALVSSRSAVKGGGAYAESKLQAEAVVQAGCAHWTILRPAEVYGLSKTTGIDKMLHDAQHRRILPCPAGPRTRLYPLHVDDAAAAIHHFVFEAWQDGATHTVNGGEGFTVPQLVRCVARHAHHWVLPLPVPRPLMRLLQRASEVSGVDLGFVPDQVPRLYCAKGVQTPCLPQMRLADYVARGAPDAAVSAERATSSAGGAGSHSGRSARDRVSSTGGVP